MIEILVRTRYVTPRDTVAIEITIPDGVPMRRVEVGALPADWDSLNDYTVARQVGDQWYDNVESTVLFVPSVACRGEWNCLIHQHHPDFPMITASAPRPVVWDERLFP